MSTPSPMKFGKKSSLETLSNAASAHRVLANLHQEAWSREKWDLQYGQSIMIMLPSPYPQKFIPAVVEVFWRDKVFARTKGKLVLVADRDGIKFPTQRMLIT